MIRSLREMIGYKAQAQDGEIGTVEDFYLDDDRWAVRYLVVDSRGWLDGRRLLFSTRALGGLDVAGKAINLPVNRATVRNSPAIEAGQPFGRQHEIELHNYYQWPLDWTPGDPGGLGPGSLAAYPLVELGEEIAGQAAHDPLRNPRLRRFQEFTHLPLQARDGGIGSIHDLLVEDEAWNILYLVVDTGGWLTGRQVLVSPSWVRAADGSSPALEVDLTKETVRNSPEYDPSVPLEREYENRLYEHYGKEKDW